MRIREITIAFCVLVASAAYGENRSHKVKEGENDFTIARKFHLSVHELHRLNPSIDWDALRIGAKLRISGSSSSDESSDDSHKSAKRGKKHSSGGGVYTVREGDTDWTLAHKFGTTPKRIRQLNPGIDWDALRIGRKVHVPSGGGEEVVEHTKSKRIRSRYVTIQGENVNVRDDASTHAESIVQVDGGTRAKVLDRSGDWYELRFPRGTEGWVRADFLAPASAPRERVSSRNHRRRGHHSSYVASSYSPRTGNQIIDKARSMYGVPYSYGSSSRSATDCSGYTSQVYRSAGIRLPRTSREQSHVGHAVSRGELRPGDLVFFKTNRGTRINHVGIYVGGGKFMHASSGRGEVTESSLDEGYYRRRYAGARRVAGGSGKSSHSKKKKALGPE